MGYTAENHDWMHIQMQKDIFIKIRMHLKIFLKVLKNLQSITNFHDDKSFYVKNHKSTGYS